MISSAVRRAFAAGVAGLLVVPALLFASVAPASAFNGSAKLGCRIYFDTGVGSSPSVYTDTFTLTTSPASPSVNDTVTVTATGANGPTNGPVPLAAGSLEVNVIVTRDGANPVTLNDATYPNGAVAAATPLGPWSATGTFNASAAGTVDLVVKQIQFDYKAGQIDTWCSAEGERDHWHAPVATTINQSVTITGTGPTPTPTPTPTVTGPPSPTGSPGPTGSPSPTVSPSTTVSPSPSVSPSPTPTPSPSQSGGSTDVSTGSATATLTCELPPAFNNSSDWKADLTVNLTGSDLALAWAAGPKTGPVPIMGGTQKATATVKAGGATVKLTAPAWGSDQPPNTPGPGQTVTGTVASTPTSISVDQIFFDDTSASNVDVTCTPKAVLVIQLETLSLPSTPPASDGPLTITGTPKAGGSVTLSGSGFGAGSGVTGVMYSSPTVLGQMAASSTGAVSMAVTIPTGTTGSHTMVMLGESPTGEQFVLSTTFTVAAASGGTTTTGETDSDELAATGPRETLLTALVAVVLLQLGLVVAVRSYRALPARRPTEVSSSRHGSHRAA